MSCESEVYAVGEFMKFYKYEYPHSALGYMSPDEARLIWRLPRRAT